MHSRGMCALAIAISLAVGSPLIASSQGTSSAGTPRHPAGLVTPQITPQQRVLSAGRPVIFTGRAAPGSVVRISAVRGGTWVFLTPSVLVPASGRVRVSTLLGAGRLHLVRADVVSADRSTRHGFGPYVVTVDRRGARPTRYVEYPLRTLLTSPGVFTPATLPATGCIGLRLSVTATDAAAGAMVTVRNPWVGRGGSSHVAHGTTGALVGPLNGGPLRIQVTSASTSAPATVRLAGTLTCPRAG